ncbi:hypothetical protein [Flavobacterium sp. UGB4466]|uniref:hypothetical protein n=1 Tax=Flavobacterium sp. UGB4466 TaxID=2730889 RepID=UPI001ED8F82C|nr:hypothetical protein [Flavobacterium sp. UGB4466]
MFYRYFYYKQFNLKKNNKLIWTGTTKSGYVTNLGQTVDAIMQAVVKEMKKDGSLPPK